MEKVTARIGNISLSDQKENAQMVYRQSRELCQTRKT